METKSIFDGLLVKTNDYAHSGMTDCSLCCINDDDCDGCPLKRGFYFADPSDSSYSSCMSEDDKSKLDLVVKDLLWLADNLKSSRNLSLVLHSTISMAISDLQLQLQRLSFIKTFDK